MSNVSGNFSFSLQDEVGVRGSLTLPVKFADTVTLAQLDTAWSTMKGLVQAVTGGSVQRGKVSFEEVVAAPTAAAADSRIEETGVFDFAISGSTHKQGIAVPAFLDSKAPLDRIDLADTDVKAFTDAITAAITGGGTYSTPDGVALGAVVDAFSSTRKKRRQLRALTLEVPA